MTKILSTITVRDTLETPSPIILDNGNWGVWDHDTGKFIDTNKAARGPQGVQGKDAIHVQIRTKGEFVQRVTARDSQGKPLTPPRKEAFVENGVRGSDGRSYLQLEAHVYKGGVDVTATALALGGGFTWLYKGSTIANGSATCDLAPETYADQNQEPFELQINTSRSREW